MPSNAFRRAIGIVVLLSLVWAAVFALNLVPLLRGGAGWRWPYELPEHPERLLVLMAVAGLYIGGAWGLFGRRRSVGLILWAMVGSVALAIAVLYVATDRPCYELFTRTASGMTTGWHYSATEIDEWGGAREVLRRWPDFMLSCVGVCVHVATSAPGMSLAYYGANRALEQAPILAAWLAHPLRSFQCHSYRLMNYNNAELGSAWLGILMPLWGSLTVWPLYWIGRRLYREYVARLGIILWPLIPAFLMFMPHPSTVYPLVSVIIVALLVEGLYRDRFLWVVASGAATSIATFISFAFLPLIFLAGLLLLAKRFVEADKNHFTWRWFLKMGAAFGIGLASLWGIYYVVSGLTPWALIASDAMREGHLVLERPYFAWLFLHMNDFFMFTGWPIILLAGLGTWRAGWSLWKRRQLSIGEALGLSAFLMLIVVDIAGFVRGETGRVWLLFSPFFLLIAVSALDQSGAGPLTWAVVGVQAIIVVVMVGVLHVIDSGLTEPPEAAPSLTERPETDYLPDGAVFGDALRLGGFAGHIEMLPNSDGVEQPTLVLWLNWQSSGQVDRPYYLSFIPVSPDGQPTRATLVQPFGGAYPTTCWRPESGLIQDRFEVPLYVDDAGGEWWVSLSVMDGDTGDKLDVTMPDGSRDDQVGIGPFRLISP